MANSRIECVKLSSGGFTHQQITHVGLSATPFLRTVPDIVELIRSRRDSFYVLDFFSGLPIPVGVVHEIGQIPYLRAFDNGVWTDDLLLVNRC